MSKCIAYYSKDGNTKAMAEAFAEKQKCDIIALVDPSSYKGIFGFLKAGFTSARKKACEMPQEVLDKIASYDELFLATPVWAGYGAPAFNAVLQGIDLSCKKVSVLTTQSDENITGAEKRDAFFKAYIEKKGGEFVKLYGFAGSKMGDKPRDKQAFLDQI
jgi:flavodoxin